MNTKTQELTYGAMIVAIFGVLLLINRQTGGFLEGVFMFIFPTIFILILAPMIMGLVNGGMGF